MSDLKPKSLLNFRTSGHTSKLRGLVTGGMDAGKLRGLVTAINSRVRQ